MCRPNTVRPMTKLYVTTSTPMMMSTIGVPPAESESTVASAAMLADDEVLGDEEAERFGLQLVLAQRGASPQLRGEHRDDRDGPDHERHDVGPVYEAEHVGQVAVRDADEALREASDGLADEDD